MRYCPVVPPNAIHLLDGINHPNIGYFCYADRAYHDPDYAMWFVDKPYVVLDCPIMEKGEILQPKELKKVVDFIRPTFTIVPDKVFDMKETLRWFYSYCEIIGHDSLTGVLQGQTAHELVTCAIEMHKYGIKRMAIPRISRNNGGTERSVILPLVRDMFPEIHWHLLGANFPYIDECRNARNALSCDTAEPVNAALNGTYIQDGQVKRPANFMQMTEVDVDSIARITYNICKVADWFKEGLVS